MSEEFTFEYRVLRRVREAGRAGASAREIQRDRKVRCGITRVETTLYLLAQNGLVVRLRDGKWIGLPPGPNEDDALDSVNRQVHLVMQDQR